MIIVYEGFSLFFMVFSMKIQFFTGIEGVIGMALFDKAIRIFLSALGLGGFFVPWL